MESRGLAELLASRRAVIQNAKMADPLSTAVCSKNPDRDFCYGDLKKSVVVVCLSFCVME